MEDYEGKVWRTRRDEMDGEAEWPVIIQTRVARM